MLKSVELPNIFVETIIHFCQKSFMNRKFIRTTFIRNRNVFTVTVFNHFFFYLTDPKVLNSNPAKVIHYSPFEPVFAILSQVNILVFLPVRIGVVEQADGPETSEAQQPESQQHQLHDQIQ